MFNIFKKDAKKENEKKMTTLEEVQKAYADLSDADKETFKQSVESRVDESVAAQESESGTEDSQTAKDRVDEAEGDENKESLPSETDPLLEAPEESKSVHLDAKEDATQIEQAIAPLKEAIAVLTTKIEEMQRVPQPVDKTTADKLTDLTNRFNN